jgi:hypothetical protein
MRICVATALPTTPPDPAVTEQTQDGAHGGCSMGREFVAELNRLGHDAECWNYWHEVEDGVSQADAFDCVIFFDNNMYELWKKVVKDWDWEKKLNVCWMHLVNLERPQSIEIATRCQLVGATCYELICELEDLVPSAKPFLWEWATTTRMFPPPQPNPYRTDKKIMLWCGRLGERAAKLLQGISNYADQLQAELHVISQTVGPDNWPYPGAPPKGAILHGAMKHGTFDHYLYYAHAAIDCALGPGQRVINCKQYDYMGAGLPIVCEPVPGYGLMLMHHFGSALPFHADNADAYASALRRELYAVYDRHHIRTWMQRGHTWTNRARLIHEKIQCHLHGQQG